MRNPNDIWLDPSYADESLAGLRDAYLDWLQTRENPISPRSLPKYRNTLNSLIHLLEEEGNPLTLVSVTPTNVTHWLGKQREKGLSEDGIASRLSTLKAFTNQYLYEFLELTTRDLLRKVKRIDPPQRSFPELTEEQQRRLVECFDRGTHEDIRNRAIIAVFLATGLRLGAVLNINLYNLNRLTGDLSVVTKGNRWHLVRLSPGALREVKTYLKRRPEPKARTEESDPLWLKEDGIPLGEWGLQSVFRRLKKRAGIPGLHAHLLRHNFAKKAARKGAARGELQDMMNHRNPTVVNRYLGDVAKEIAARNTARYSPLP